METLYYNQLGLDLKDDYALIRTGFGTDIVNYAPRIPYMEQKYKKRLTMKKEIYSKISHFISTIKEKMPNYDLTTFFRNLQTLNIITFDDSKIKRNYNGLYLYSANKIITVYHDDFSTIYHELYHLSNSYRFNDVTFMGFSQIRYNPISVIGKGVNEGYTALLTRRNFGRDKSNLLGQFFMETIERIIGPEKLESLYNKMDLLGLIKETSFHTIDEEFLEAIKYLDTIISGQGDVLSAYQNMYVNITDILIKTVKTKIKYGLTSIPLAQNYINQQLVSLNSVYSQCLSPKTYQRILTPKFNEQINNKIWTGLHFERVK